MTARDLRRLLAPKLAELAHARRRQEEESLALGEAREVLKNALEAQKAAQGMAASAQKAAHARVASVVTRCLQSVFEEGYTFDIAFEQKRGKTEARLLFRKGELEVSPVHDDSGGVLDVASFALRLACLMLSRPRRRKLLVLDEPFRMLDAANARRLRELLLLLAQEMGVQILMVTHNTGLRVGKVIDLE